jgi:uncharacterized protein YigE (DUF2233 family)
MTINKFMATYSNITQRLRFRALLIPLVVLCTTPMQAAPEKKIIDGITYHILSTPAFSIKIIWKDDAGKAMRTFPEVARWMDSKKIAVDTLMNGGIFEPGGIPSGLLIQEGKEINPVNRNRGEGNFFLQPNGIFLIHEGGAAVIRTDEYPLRDQKIHYAVQSGPLLLRQGKTHPVFRAESTSRLHRNGVGVAKTGEVIFVMTDFRSAKFPNLYEFADLFRKLGCEDALFLDGDISQMRSGADIYKDSNSFGSTIVVTQGPAVKSPP